MEHSSPVYAVILSATLAACGGSSEAGPEPVDTSDLFLEDMATDSMMVDGDLGSFDAEVETATTPTGALGLPMGPPGVTWVGVAEVDITPEIVETYTDENENHHYDPGEPFDDVDGDGVFEPVWIAGFDPRRAATGVHDPLLIRTMVVVRDGEYVIFAGMDLVGLLHPRIDQARDVLATEDGMDPIRLVAASTHNHQGPDVFGIWGNTDLDSGSFSPGFDPAYQAFVVQALIDSVRLAAANVRASEITMGMEDMATASHWFSGYHFDGGNPNSRVRGLIRDIRDPVIASTQVFVMHAQDPETDEGIATLLVFSGHPETWGDENTQLSADWVGAARDRIDSALGGKTVFMPESLGGMQSMLGAPIPLVDPDGEWVWQEGVEEPVWAETETWDYVFSAGVHVADAALAAVEDGTTVTAWPLEVNAANMPVLIDNDGWAFGAAMGIADMDTDQLVKDPELCPGYVPGGLQLGCTDVSTWRIRLGPLAIITAPGELLPELFHGVPDDPRYAEESTDPGKRGSSEGRDSAYFPQHPPACDAVDFEECRHQYAIGDCNCLSMHAVPYDHGLQPTNAPPLAHLLSDDALFKVAMSATGGYMSYIIPAGDFNTEVSLLDGPVGDHYEDSVSASSTFAPTLQSAQLSLGDENEQR